MGGWGGGITNHFIMMFKASYAWTTGTTLLLLAWTGRSFYGTHAFPRSYHQALPWTVGRPIRQSTTSVPSCSTCCWLQRPRFEDKEEDQDNQEKSTGTSSSICDMPTIDTTATTLRSNNHQITAQTFRSAMVTSIDGTMVRLGDPMGSGTSIVIFLRHLA